MKFLPIFAHIHQAWKHGPPQHTEKRKTASHSLRSQTVSPSVFDLGSLYDHIPDTCWHVLDHLIQGNKPTPPTERRSGAVDYKVANGELPFHNLLSSEDRFLGAKPSETWPDIFSVRKSHA